MEKGFEGSREELRELLDREAARFNSPDFIAADPVQFPRRFDRLADIEIVSLLASTVAWGNRKMICTDIEKMLRLMDYDPAAFLLEGAYEEIPDMNIHRTFFARDLRGFLRGLHPIYKRYGSLQDFARASGIAQAEFPPCRDVCRRTWSPRLSSASTWPCAGWYAGTASWISESGM